MNQTEFSKRLRDLLASRRITQKDLVAICQPLCSLYDVTITKADISHYCCGLYEPKEDKLSVIAEALEVSVAYLRGYESEDTVTLTDTEQALVNSWRLAPDEIKRIVAFTLSDYGMPKDFSLYTAEEASS